MVELEMYSLFQLIYLTLCGLEKNQWWSFLKARLAIYFCYHMYPFDFLRYRRKKPFLSKLTNSALLAIVALAKPCLFIEMLVFLS